MQPICHDTTTDIRRINNYQGLVSLDYIPPRIFDKDDRSGIDEMLLLCHHTVDEDGVPMVDEPL